MNRKIIKIALPCLILVLVLPILVVLSAAKPVEAGCGCGGGSPPPPPTTYTISVGVSPSGGGNIEVDEQVPDSYPYNRNVTKGYRVHLEAVPAPGYYFVNWSGHLTGNENPTDVNMNSNKAIIANFFPEEFISEDEMLRITIPEGTVVLNKDGEPLTSLELTINEQLLPLPPEADIVGVPYKLGPIGTTFDQQITITCSYDPFEIPPKVAEENLAMGYYNEDAGEWVMSPSVVDTLNNTVSTLTDHLSTFTIIAPVPPPTPAAFTPSTLSISPPEVDIGETASISVLVTNTGEQEAVYIVTLKINEIIEETKAITLAGGSETVTFTMARDEAGTYSVDVNGLQGSLMVKEPQHPPPASCAGVKWTIIGLVIAVAVFLAIFLPIRLLRRRALR